MNYVIFGAGYRGIRLKDKIGKYKISAFIDSDLFKIGTFIDGIPIINIETYINRYRDEYIIISPSYTNEIEDLLYSFDIFNFCNVRDLPSEYKGYGNCEFNECFSFLLNMETNKYYIYGLNAFSIMLFEYLISKNKQTYFIPEKNVKVKVFKYFQEKWGKKNIKTKIKQEKHSVILLSIREEKNMIKSIAGVTRIIDAFDLSNDYKGYYNYEIAKMQFRLKKKRCFIVATGPSLLVEDIDILYENNEFCFGVNKIYNINHLWKPDVYVAIDSYFIKMEQEKINSYKVPIKMIGDGYDDFWKFNTINTFKVHVVSSDGYDVAPPFSTDIAQKVYGGFTVTYACIQMAVYFGFKKIYLLGVDCNYLVNTKGNHFYETEVVDNMNHNERGMLMAYKSAKYYANKNGIKICNATRGGKLEIFERVEFDSIFSINDGKK